MGAAPGRGWGGGVGRGCLALVSVPEFRSVGRVKGWTLLRLFSRKLESSEERKTPRLLPSKSGALSPSGWGIFVSDEPPSPRDVCLGGSCGTGTSTYNLLTHMPLHTHTTQTHHTRMPLYPPSHTFTETIHSHSHSYSTQSVYTTSLHSHANCTFTATALLLVRAHIRSYVSAQPSCIARSHSFPTFIYTLRSRHSPQALTHTFTPSMPLLSLFAPGGLKGQLPSEHGDRTKSPGKATLE